MRLDVCHEGSYRPLYGEQSGEQGRNHGDQEVVL